MLLRVGDCLYKLIGPMFSDLPSCETFLWKRSPHVSPVRECMLGIRIHMLSSSLRVQTTFKYIWLLLVHMHV